MAETPASVPVPAAAPVAAPAAPAPVAAPAATEAKNKSYIIVGSGWFGTNTAKLIQKTLKNVSTITMVELGNKDYIDANVQNPRCVVDPDFAKKIFPTYEKALGDKIILEHVKEVKNVSVGSVQVVTTKDEEKTLVADVVIVATGMGHKSKLMKNQTGMSREERIKMFEEYRDAIKASKGIIIAGGGPTGVEMAAEIATDFPGKKVTLVCSTERLLVGVKSENKMGAAALKKLQALKVEVLLNDRVVDLDEDYKGETKEFSTKGGKTIPAEIAIVCVNGKPNVAFMPQGTIDSETGGIKIDKKMTVMDMPAADLTKPVFAIGDCTMYGGRLIYGYQQLPAITASLKHYDLTGSMDKAKDVFKHVPNNEVMAMVSIGRNGAVSSMSFGGEFMGKMFKSKDMLAKPLYGQVGVKIKV
eukprot:CAMPEP_0184691494 /NCGR_PEP_ID=MMETSP0313-20130426/330_1 /TAXON_ID=2792 /ORGANISM="Porphyridium aerugineum, Strain SAG 1380-2" /LENGTH=414 /DNA_ID=CAMNT_0027149227 /DNA_START=104 /DNA_END=1348 /DNA_ORIENTATION=+